MRRIPALDGLRGLAVLLVMVHHSAPAPAALPGAGIVLSIVLSSWIGADLLMVLSGFFITRQLIDNRHRPDRFKWFYASRARRMLPAYYALLLTLLALTRVLDLNWQGRQYMLLTFTHNVGIASPVEFDVGVALRHLWSASLETHFYLLWPLAVYGLTTTRRLALVAIAVSLTALGLRFLALHHAWSFYDICTMTPFRIDTLLAGALLAMAWHTPRAKAAAMRHAPTAFVLAAGATVFLTRQGRSVRWDSAVMEGFGFNWIACVFVCLIAMALTPGSVTARLFATPWFRFLGKYSYGIYLVHLPISEASEGIREWIRHLSGNHPLNFLVSNAVIMALAIGIAMASYHLIEQPFLRWKPRLAG